MRKKDKTRQLDFILGYVWGFLLGFIAGIGLFW